MVLEDSKKPFLETLDAGLLLLIDYLIDNLCLHLSRAMYPYRQKQEDMVQRDCIRDHHVKMFLPGSD